MLTRKGAGAAGSLVAGSGNGVSEMLMGLGFQQTVEVLNGQWIRTAVEEERLAVGSDIEQTLAISHHSLTLKRLDWFFKDLRRFYILSLS